MDKVSIKLIAQQIKSERLSKGLTQQELAEETGISLRSIQRIENGEVYPRSFTLKVLAEKLELNFEGLNVKKLKTTTEDASPSTLNKPQKIVASSVVALVFLLLVCAFIFQSPTFPESAFELTLLLAAVIGVYGLVLFRIWR